MNVFDYSVILLINDYQLHLLLIACGLSTTKIKVTITTTVWESHERKMYVLLINVKKGFVNY